MSYCQRSRSRSNDSGWMSEEVKDALLPRFPMGRIGLPEV